MLSATDDIIIPFEFMLILSFGKSFVICLFYN
jgi:hypothetical protein